MCEGRLTSLFGIAADVHNAPVKSIFCQCSMQMALATHIVPKIIFPPLQICLSDKNLPHSLLMLLLLKGGKMLL